MNTQLKQNLRRLRLSGLMDTLELRLNEAVGNQLTHVEFLEGGTGRPGNHTTNQSCQIPRTTYHRRF